MAVEECSDVNDNLKETAYHPLINPHTKIKMLHSSTHTIIKIVANYFSVDQQID